MTVVLRWRKSFRMVAKMEGQAPSHLRRIRHVIIFISRRQFFHLRVAAKVRRFARRGPEQGVLPRLCGEKGKRTDLLAKKGHVSQARCCGVLMPARQCGLCTQYRAQSPNTADGDPFGGTGPVPHRKRGGAAKCLDPPRYMLKHPDAFSGPHEGGNSAMPFRGS